MFALRGTPMMVALKRSPLPISLWKSTAGLIWPRAEPDWLHEKMKFQSCKLRFQVVAIDSVRDCVLCPALSCNA